MTRSTPLRILLAEDNSGDVFLVQRALQTHRIDCEITVLEDGEAATQYLSINERSDDPQSRLDLILLDLNLPRCSGSEILQQLRLSTHWRDTPVIILTSSDSPSERADALRSGATHYFCKPTDLAGFMSLGQVVKNVMSSQFP